MKLNIQTLRFLLLVICLLGIGQITKAQSSFYDIKPVNGKYAFSYNDIPEDIVSTYSSITNLDFKWEQSLSPVDGFTVIPGISQSNYSFTAPLTQTTYFRRLLTLGSVTLYSNVVKIEVVSINWENINYVREHDVLIPGITNWMDIDQLPIGSKLQTTTYMDGLGRPIEKVSRETATPNDPTEINNLWGDEVQFANYDALGRQPKQYLPFTTVTNSGKFKSNPLTEQPDYYTNVFNETSAFSNPTFDNSPLNRVVNVNQPGTSWASSAGSSVSYEVNNIDENVQIFDIGYSSGDAPVSLGKYPTNVLFKIRTNDENGKQVIEYINKSGQLILKKVQIADNPSVAHDGWICVYSVYDDFGLLRYNLQPEAVKWLDTHGWSFAGADGAQVLNEMCFRYEYDDKRRTILKKAPGAKEINMIYDKRDRIVFMQDGNQRVKSPAEWTTNLYDELDRPIITLLYHTNKTITNLQGDITGAIHPTTVTVTNPSSLQINLITDHRDLAISNYHAQQSIEFIAGFESGTNDQFTAEIDPSALTQPVTVSSESIINPISVGDLANSSITTIVKYLFYDNYNYSSVKAFNTNFDNSLAYSSGDPIENTQRTLSMCTGIMTRVLGTNTFLTTTIYYDDKRRTVQKTEDNIKSGTDVLTLQYDFDDRLLSYNTKHTTAGSGYGNFSIVTRNIFDKVGKVIRIEKKYGNNDFKDIVAFSFDDMGRLKSKRLDPEYTGSGRTEMETLNYSYNIHSDLIGINKDYALKTPGNYNKWDNFFGLYLGYDNRDAVFTNQKLDGHITGTLWSTQGDDALRKYDFSYDNAGRLINAYYKEKQKLGDSWSNSSMDFSVTGYNGKIEYDLNGNLLAMLQKGVVVGNQTPFNVDDLRYTYVPLSNKLLKVKDLGSLSTNNGKLGDFSDGSNPVDNDDYVYDDNGNLVVDLNKGAKDLSVSESNGIRYNFLDKPEEIHIPGKGTIKMVYDANGKKLQRFFTPEGSSVPIITTYIHEFVYQGDKVQYINFEEGRIRVMQTFNQDNGLDMVAIAGNIDLPDNKRGTYDFFIRDYQSNVRMILTEETHIGRNVCTMEPNRATNEEPVFGQVNPATGLPTAANEVSTTRSWVANIPDYGTSQGWNNPSIQTYVSRLTPYNNGKMVGPNTLLKVMAGDEVSAQTNYFYKNAVVNSNTGNTLLTNIVNALVGAISGSTVANSFIKGSTTNITSTVNGSAPFSNATSPDANNPNGNKPKAYLTILFFDERFNFVDEGSTAVRVDHSGYIQGQDMLNLTNIKAPKNGYAYIYVSNESFEPVYFDNLQVTHNRGRIVEEDHYYAYGLKIAAISSKKLGESNEGQLKNNNLFNDKQLNDEADLNWYDYGFRNYDPQIGRFPQLDPLTDYYPSLTPYQYASNDPILNIDLDGLEGVPFNVVQTLGNVTIAATRTAHVVSTTSQIITVGAKLAINITAGILDNVPLSNETSANNIINVSNTENKPRLFIYPVLESLTPDIFSHIKDAITVEGKPFVLTYDSDKEQQFKRRNLVCPQNLVRPDGQSCDEYPFACTKEGGVFNGSMASTRMVSRKEQSIQGGTISILKTVFGMKDGDKIFVVPISKEYENANYPKSVPEKQVDPWYNQVGEVLEKLLDKFAPPIPVPPFLPDDPYLNPVQSPGRGWQLEL